MSISVGMFEILFNSYSSVSEMETGRVDRHRSGRPAGWVAGRVEILRRAGQAG